MYGEVTECARCAVQDLSGPTIIEEMSKFATSAGQTKRLGDVVAASRYNEVFLLLPLLLSACTLYKSSFTGCALKSDGRRVLCKSDAWHGGVQAIGNWKFVILRLYQTRRCSHRHHAITIFSWAACRCDDLWCTQEDISAVLAEWSNTCNLILTTGASTKHKYKHMLSHCALSTEPDFELI